MNRKALSYFVFAVLLFNCLVFFPVPVSADSDNWTVSNTYDDAYCTGDDDSVTTGSSYVYVYADTTDVDNTRSTGLRFLNVDVPQGSTITNACLRLYRISGTNNDIDAYIYAEDTATTQDFNDNPYVYTAGNRPRTSASYYWYEATAFSSWWLSPNFSTVVQEVIDRGDWVSGYNLTILLIANVGVSTYKLDFLSTDYDSYDPVLYLEWTPPVTYVEYKSISDENYYVADEYGYFNSTIHHDNGREDLVNCTISFDDGGVIVAWDNATNTFSEYVDSSNLITLNDSACSTTVINDTDLRVNFNLAFNTNYSLGYRDILESNSYVYGVDDDSDRISYVDAFFLFNASDIIAVGEDYGFAYGWSNFTGETYQNYTAESCLDLNIEYDDATLLTRSLSDFGDAVTNYATLYFISDGFCYGWSSTIYDVWRNQSYECVGEPDYNDWLFNGLIAPPSFPSTFAPSLDLPWYFPTLIYLLSIFLPFMIVGYYISKIRDFYSGAIAFIVCLLCFMMLIIGFHIGDAVTEVMYGP